MAKVEADGCLARTLGPWIPLSIPWVDLWVDHGYRYPEGFVEVLQSLLRPDVLYVKVSQNDKGIVGNYELWPVPANLLVLLAGGYGHVPIPLIKQTEPLRAARRRRLHQVS